MNDWSVTDGPPVETGQLVLGTALTGVMSSTCPQTILGVTNPQVVDTAVTDGLGDAGLSFSVPLAASGREVYAQVVFPGTCSASCVSVTSVP